MSLSFAPATTSKMLRSIVPKCQQQAAAVAAARQCSRRFLSTTTTTTPTTAAHAQPCRPTTLSQRCLRSSPSYNNAQRRYKHKTVEEAKSRYRTGPFSWKAGALFVLTGGGLVWYFEFEKQRMQRKRVAEATKGVGRPKVGGEFELTDQNGKPFSSADLKGRYSLVYFGFTHCPDICPEELDKMARMFDLVEAERPELLVPVFVTCDPQRDDPATLKTYLSEFHPRFVGLTGTYEQIKDVCKAYRVYFSTPREAKPGVDYLVDHSIYFYLMDPEGDFVEALGRQHSPEAAAKVILDHVKDWRGPIKQ
ncbi:electron transport protein [Apiospora phragmitis]|uniref:Electron transport protein n=1 Tax=Apiospora phragmitis TaxID=2905665 RepID=A0ABR1VVF6_9PEZI